MINQQILQRIVISISIVLGLFLFTSAINNLKEFGYIGQSPSFQNVLPVTGKADVFVVPDVSMITFTIKESEITALEAKNKANQKNNEVIAFLKQQGILEKDIKTIGYSSGPDYEYNPTTGKQILKGYVVDINLQVKIRDPKIEGTVLSAVGDLGVSNISNLSFIVDDEAGLKRQARDMAIEDAKVEARKLADKLGLRLGRVVGYYESENPIYPMYEMGGADMMMKSAAPSVRPQIQSGEQKITSTVTVNFEIR